MQYTREVSTMHTHAAHCTHMHARCTHAHARCMPARCTDMHAAHARCKLHAQWGQLHFHVQHTTDYTYVPQTIIMTIYWNGNVALHPSFSTSYMHMHMQHDRLKSTPRVLGLLKGAQPQIILFSPILGDYGQLWVTIAWNWLVSFVPNFVYL
jgi:hypothetical protein